MHLTLESLIRLIIVLPIFLISISLHEFAHAWAADRLGDPTPRAMGRLTINPRAHLDPLGAIMFILGALTGFFIGWAKPVPTNPYNFRQPRRDFAFVALSGPASNFMQAVAWYILWWLVHLLPGSQETLVRFLLYFTALGVIVNIALLAFNIVPIPPLDGSRVLAWLLPPRHAYMLDRMESYGFVILLVLWVTGILRYIYFPLLALFLRLFPGIG